MSKVVIINISIRIIINIIGGRTMLVYLAMEDALQLHRSDGTGRIGHATFCVSLTTFDIV